MRKQFIVFMIILVVLAGIVFILFSNKAKMAAKMHRQETNVYAVSVVTVAKQRLNDSFTLIGTVAANNDVIVTAGLPGRVTNIPVKVGDYVEAGTVLAVIFDDYAKITTPISGLVNDLSVSIGTSLTSSTVIANIIDISTLKLKLNAGEEDVFKLSLGDSVTIETAVYPGVKFTGQIESISQKGDEAHTYPVKVRFPNSKRYPLKAGMFAQATFQTHNDGFGVVIPRNALVADNLSTPQVYVIDDGIAKPRNIILGREVGANFEVRQGLTAGETIVIKGQLNLKDGVTVDIVK